MSNDLVVSGGGAVVPATTGGTVGEHIGDVSLDRGGDPGSGAQVLHGELQRAVGVALSRDQVQRAAKVLMRYRLAEDERQRVAAEAAIKARWGAATEGNLIKINGWLFDTMGKDLADAFKGARDSDGMGICNKPAMLEAMLKAAQATPATRTGDNNGGGARHQGAISSARLREIESMMADRNSAYHKGPDAESLQAEYRLLVDQGATGDGTAKVADSAIDQRIAERQRRL